MKIRTRFAPSPTGYLHIGGARTALYCWLYARRHGGQFVLRIEDTDRERSTEESVQAILDGMRWLDLPCDEGPVFQTQRFDRYREVVRQLLDSGHAYRCYCSREELDEMRAAQMARKEKPRYDGRCRRRSEPREGVEPVIRFRNPTEGEVVIDDLCRGPITIANSELDDLIIARSDGTPTYNLTVVVDDWDMGITHVIRGDDHINNTPRQINIFRALGAPLPQFAHLPMILGEDGKRLSKRHGAVSVMQYHEDGYLPEALINYLVRLGWSHGDQEIFSREEMIEHFALENIGRSGSVFNPEKLAWLNQQYIKQADGARLAALLGEQLDRLGVEHGDGPPLAEVVEAQRERAQTLVEMAEQSRFFFEEPAEYDAKAAKKNLRPVAVEPLQTVRAKLAAVEDWGPQSAHAAIQSTVDELGVGFGKVGLPLRVATTGGLASPGLDVTLALIGRERVLARIDAAIAWIAAKSADGG